jgi:hypothetical protein
VEGYEGGESTHELRDHPEFDEVLGLHLRQVSEIISNRIQPVLVFLTPLFTTAQANI